MKRRGGTVAGMRSAHVDEYIERYVDGSLPREQAVRVARHERSCVRCKGRIDAARLIVDALSAEPLVRAPSGFAGRIMDAVYREALRGDVGTTAAGEEGKARFEGPLSPARIYRRLGFSFVLTAVVLSATVFLPRASYPVLVGTSSVSEVVSQGGGKVVKNALHGADMAVRDAIHARNGGIRR